MSDELLGYVREDLKKITEKVDKLTENVTILQIKVEELNLSRTRVLSTFTQISIPIVLSLITVFITFQLNIWKIHI